MTATRLADIEEVVLALRHLAGERAALVPEGGEALLELRGHLTTLAKVLRHGRPVSAERMGLARNEPEPGTDTAQAGEKP